MTRRCETSNGVLECWSMGVLQEGRGGCRAAREPASWTRGGAVAPTLHRSSAPSLRHSVAPLFLSSLLFVVLSSSATAQTLSLDADPADGLRAAGQPAAFVVKVEGDAAGTVSRVRYTIKKGGATVLREGELPLAGGAGRIEASLDEPGTLLAEVRAKGADGKELKALAGLAFSPEKIGPSAPCPDDFDAFWKAKLAELAAVPANPRLEPADGGRAGVEYGRIVMDNIRGTRIHGQWAQPKDGAKLPAMLIVQWAGVYPLQKNWVTDPAAEGWLALNIMAHDLPADRPQEFYKEQSDGPLKDYPGIGNDDRETSYFLRMYLSCYRAAEYLSGRPDWDGRTMVVTGGSQGGLQSIMIAGLHPKITALMACVPAGCDHTGPMAGRAPGWPGWYYKTDGRDAAKVRDASRYFDVVHFAARVKCPALVGLGLIDQTCPPAGVFAACNRMQGPCERVVLPRGDHGGSAGSHAKYYERLGAWKAALRAGQPLPPPAAKP